MNRFGEVVDINMPRDKETHKTKGFAFVMYEDQRSTVLAVDNMGGAQVLGRTIRVCLIPLSLPHCMPCL
jgi:RNA-binding motif X-linked protein 2